METYATGYEFWALFSQIGFLAQPPNWQYVVSIPREYKLLPFKTELKRQRRNRKDCRKSP